MKLNPSRLTKRRLPTRLRQPLAAPNRPNEIWALDFMADALYGGRAFRTLNVIDEGNREIHGIPRALRRDNGSELTSTAFTDWCAEVRIELRFIQPGKPDQNALIERFNKTYRDEALDAYAFDSLEQVREITESWLPEYNEERPHDSLGRVPSLTFLPRPQLPRESSSKLCA